MAGALNIGTLSGRIELEDKLSSGMDIVLGRIDQLDKRFGGLGQRVAEGAASFFTAEAALKAMSYVADIAASALKNLTVEGAGAADIEENFNRLNEQAGRLGSTLLGELQEGLHNTVTELDLMVAVNQNLAAGLQLTDEQYRSIADGAFALAQATGIDVKEAFDKVNDAMLTGRTRGVAMLTGKIDLAAAEEAYAKSIGKTVEQLTGEGKLHAARIAILEKVGAATTRLGEQTDGIDEMVAQAQVAWSNFQTELGKTVATSPVLMTGLMGIKDAVMEAFGGNQETLVKNIANWIDRAAIKALEFAQVVVDGIGLAGITWNSFKIIIETSAQGFRAITYVVEQVLLSLMEIANFVSGGNLFGDAIEATRADIERLYNDMAVGEQRITEYQGAQDEWAVSTGKINEKLAEIRDKMVAAGEAAVNDAAATDTLTEASDRSTTSAGALGAATDVAAHSMAMTAAESAKYAEALESMNTAGAGVAGTLATINGEIVEAVKYYLEAGVSLSQLALVYGLTDTQAQAINESWKAGNELLKDQKKAADEMAEAWIELNSIGDDQQTTLAGVGDRLIDDIKHYIDMGASIQTLKAAYPELTEAQLKAIGASDALKVSFDQQAVSVAQVVDQVRTLSGEMISLAEAESRRTAGGSFDNTIDQFEIDQTGPEELLRELKQLSESVPNRQVLDMHSYVKLLKDQARLAALKAIYEKLKAQTAGDDDVLGGGGGSGNGPTVGEIPAGTGPAVGTAAGGTTTNTGGGVVMNFQVNGTAEESARKISTILMKDLKTRRQFGAA